MSNEFEYREPDPNKKSAKDRWDALYAGSSFLFGKEPIAFLKDSAQHFMKGPVLDVACGEGRNAVFLAQQGHAVTGLDCSPVAIERGQKLAAEKSVQVEFKVQNLDFYLVPLMKFSNIIMTYFRPQARFFSEIRRGLAMNGFFLLEAFTVSQLKSQQLKHLEFEDCYKPNEVLTLLKGFHILYYKEMEIGGQRLVQVLAQKAAV